MDHCEQGDVAIGELRRWNPVVWTRAEVLLLHWLGSWNANQELFRAFTSGTGSAFTGYYLSRDQTTPQRT